MNAGGRKADRYVSFSGIDCDGNSRRVVEAVLRHIDQPGRSNAFWEAFRSKIDRGGDALHRKGDDLRVVCSHIAYIEELFEQYRDADALELLHRLEEECC